MPLKPQQATTGLTALPQVEGEATRHNVTGPSKEPFSQRCSIRPDTAYRPSACCLPTNLARSQGELSPGLARAPARPRSGVLNGTARDPACVCRPRSHRCPWPLSPEHTLDFWLRVGVALTMTWFFGRRPCQGPRGAAVTVARSPARPAQPRRAACEGQRLPARLCGRVCCLEAEPSARSSVTGGPLHSAIPLGFQTHMAEESCRPYRLVPPAGEVPSSPARLS